MQRLVNWRAAEFRLLAFYCILLLALCGAFLAFTVQSFDQFETQSVTSEVKNRATEIWDMGDALLDRPAELRDILERRFSPASHNRFIRIVSDGHVMYQSGKPADGGFDPDRVPMPDARSVAPRNGQHFGNLFVYLKTFKAADGRVVAIQSGRSVELAQIIRHNLVSSLLLSLPILLLSTAVGGYFLVRRAWAPLGDMIRAAEAITFNDPHNRLPLSGTGDRIDGLGQALNRMLDRLDSAYQHANRFSADAAHEIRTPLAIIRGELEMVAAKPGLSLEVQDSLESISDEVRRLADMAENLLTIASLDSMWGKKAHASVDLSALAFETSEQMNLLAEEKQIDLTIHADGPVFVAGDRNRLKQVLVNLLDNAIKYTPERGRVEIEICSQRERACLSVRDTGIGVPAEHLEDIFRRFFRLSTDRGLRGTGLGLSIARAICQAHGGTLTAHHLTRTGTEFRLELPAERS
jgi:signal transduction histidine kinase